MERRPKVGNREQRWLGRMAGQRLSPQLPRRYLLPARLMLYNLAPLALFLTPYLMTPYLAHAAQTRTSAPNQVIGQVIGQAIGQATTRGLAQTAAKPVATTEPTLATEPQESTNQRRYELSEALTDARQHSPALSAAEQYVIGQSAAHQATKSTRWPQLSVSSYVGNYVQQKQQLTPSYITFNGQRWQFGSYPGVTTTTGTLSQIGLNLDQNLLSFGRQEANEAMANSQYKIARWEYERSAIQLNSQVIENFVGCYTAGQITAVKKSYLDNVTLLAESVNAKYDQGAGSITDWRLAEIARRDANSDLVLAETNQTNICQNLSAVIGGEKQRHQNINNQTTNRQVTEKNQAPYKPTTDKQQDARQLAATLSTTAIDRAEQLLPASRDELLQRVLAHDPGLAEQNEAVVLARAQENLTLAQMMPNLNLHAGVEQVTSPSSSSAGGVSNGNIINNRNVGLTLLWQTNPARNLLLWSSGKHNRVAQQYSVAAGRQQLLNVADNLWQEYNAKRRTLPLIIATVQELRAIVADNQKQYNLRVVPLSYYLDSQRQLLATIEQYYLLRQQQMVLHLSLLLLTGLFS